MDLRQPNEQKVPPTLPPDTQTVPMPTLRFILIGGFLGAGKTSTIARLARRYQDRGLKVGIVTNDQAADLVDTHSLRAQGHLVGEVAGACFCCNFNELIDTVGRLEESGRPDVILAEPVGSCTDLAATVIQPLVQLYQARFEVAPYVVILKPSHGQRILSGRQSSGFSGKAAYIFRKQLEEADLILINRIDELSPEEIAELTQSIESEQPGVPVLHVSAKTGQGFDELDRRLDERGRFGRRILEIDYDTYADGEAELGWLNSSLAVDAQRPFELDALLRGVVSEIRDQLAAADAETAHLKVIGQCDQSYGVANLVSSFSEPELSIASNCRPRSAQLVVNARVGLDPAVLEPVVRSAVESACACVGLAHYLGRNSQLSAGPAGADARKDEGGRRGIKAEG